MTNSYSRGSHSAASTGIAVATRYLAAAKAAARTRRLSNPSLRVEEANARASLQLIESLQTGWDGYGAAPISTSVRVNAWHAFNQFSNAQLIPEISPNSNGTVSLEWEVNGVAAHFQVGRTTYSMYIRPAEGKTRYFNGNIKAFGKGPIDALASAIRANGPFDEPVTRIEYRASREFLIS